MVLLGDDVQVQARFGLFRDSANLDARLEHGLLGTYYRLKWELISVCLEIVLILTPERCMVCDESTIGLKILLDAPDGTPW
jgi:hypothetical protein